VIAIELLIGSALGELGEADEAQVEEHVVSCGECAARYASFVRLGPAIAAVTRSGAATFVATARVVERLEAEGLISRRYTLAPGTIVPCTVTPADVYSLVRFEADLRGVSRVDLRSAFRHVTDVPFDPTADCIYTVTSSASLLPLPSTQLRFELHAVEPDGTERRLGEYTLDHAAYAPG
jgi:hypothetical protein